MAEYISKEKVLKFLTQMADEAQKDADEYGGESVIYAECLEDVIADIERLPAADERDGGVVELPCRVGRRVYVPDFETQTVANLRVQGISITPTGRVVVHFGGYPPKSAWGDRCGIDWFLTYEGAEAALRRANDG